MTYYGPWQTAPNVTDHHDFLRTDTDVPEPASFYWTSTSPTENDAARGAGAVGGVGSLTQTFTEHVQVGHVVDMSGATSSTYRWGKYALAWTPPYSGYLPPPPPHAFWDVDTDGQVLDATLTLTPHSPVTGFAGAVYYGFADWRGGATPTFILGSFAFGASPTIPVSPDPQAAGSGILTGSFGIAVGVNFDVWDTLMTDGVPGGVVNDTAFVELTATITATIKLPRFRVSRDGRPPLAHRQRQDGAATAGPSLAWRQGAIGGGRPPLAWRQNNP